MTDREGFITLTGPHGSYQTRPSSLDDVMEKYLPASVAKLQDAIRERSGDPEYTIGSITEGLMILQEYDGRSTN